MIKRRHGLSRCRYRGVEGMKRWVGLGVIADNLINIGNALAVVPCVKPGGNSAPLRGARAENATQNTCSSTGEETRSRSENVILRLATRS